MVHGVGTRSILDPVLGRQRFFHEHGGFSLAHVVMNYCCNYLCCPPHAQHYQFSTVSSYLHQDSIRGESRVK